MKKGASGPFLVEEHDQNDHDGSKAQQVFHDVIHCSSP
jgi:hypothetical protein